MACNINIPELKIQPQNEIDSWLKFINRFKIATIATDFGHKVNIEVYKKTTEAVVRGMEVIIARLGVPITIRSDNGPCFSSDALEKSIEEWKINHITSSPHYPESNGLAERSVGTIKRMWRREENKNVALMVYRNTPLGGGKSPAEPLFGRNLRTNLPRGANEKTLEEFKKKRQRVKRISERIYG